MEGGNASTSGNYNARRRPHLHDCLELEAERAAGRHQQVRSAQVGSDFGIPKNNELGIPNGNIDGHPTRPASPTSTSPAIRRTGSPGFTNSVRIGKTVQVSDTLSRGSSNKHSVKFGGDYRHITSTLTNPQTQPRGPLHVRLAITRATTARPTRATPLASFLLGLSEPSRPRLRRHVSRGPDSLRRLLRAGRFPRHAQPDGQPRTCGGTC